MPWPEGWPIQNCLRRKCEILIHTCAFRRCLTFCRCSPQISLDGPMPSEALACLIKWQCEGDERSRRTSAKGPACVKTHTWAKCRKCNSPVWHPTVRPQHYQFSLRAISPRCFYARGGRWSFHTAWVKFGLPAIFAIGPLLIRKRTFAP